MKVKARTRPSREERYPGRWVSICPCAVAALLLAEAVLPCLLTPFVLECARPRPKHHIITEESEVPFQVPSFRKEWVGQGPGAGVSDVRGGAAWARAPQFRFPASPWGGHLRVA